MAHKAHPSEARTSDSEPPLFISDPRAANWIKGQSQTTDERVAKALAESAAQTARRNTLSDADSKNLWHTVKADMLRFPLHKRGFASCEELMQHLGPRPEGAILYKATTREPHSPGNTFWGDAKGKRLVPISQASRKAHTALRRALKAVPTIPANLYRVKSTQGKTREQAQAEYELTHGKLLKPVPKLPAKPKMSAWENMRLIKDKTKIEDDEQVALLETALTKGA